MFQLACTALLVVAVVQGATRNVPQLGTFHRTDIYQPDFHQAQRYRDTRSVRGQIPAAEVLMHLPQPFRSVGEFRNFLGVQNDRKKRNATGKKLVDVRSYQVAQFAPYERRKRQDLKRQKREAGLPDSETVSKSLKVDESPKYLASFSPETIIELPEPVRGPVYTAHPGKGLELTSDYDPDDLRKRRASLNDDDETNMREKRTYMDTSGDQKESTTSAYWKRKKESPPFVTGKETKSQSYTPPQHRSMDSSRESHSMKDLDKTVLSNEIPRSSQDSYYASTNRRAYNSRQAENFTPSPPKSVYDTLEANARRRGQESRGGFSRNVDSERDTRQNYETDPYRQYPYPRVYDRYVYPYPGEVVGRGVEYYHRTYDPASGRIIYYANLPENGRTNYDPTGRNYFANGRTYSYEPNGGRSYSYEPYGRSYVYPYEYRVTDQYGRPLDYIKDSRALPDPYAGYQGGDKIQRDTRYDVLYGKDRYREDGRNRTYVIYDAEDTRASYPRTTYLSDVNRGYPSSLPSSIVPPTPAVPYQPAPGPGYQAYPNYQYRTQYYPTSPTWGSSTRPLGGYTEPAGYPGRGYKIPEIPHPLPESRNFNYDKIRKT